MRIRCADGKSEFAICAIGFGAGGFHSFFQILVYCA